MKAFIAQEAARRTRSLRGLPRKAWAKLRLLAEVAHAWRWGAVLGRIVLAGLGLVLLGAIGRSALARSMLSPEPEPVASVLPRAMAAPPAAPEPGPPVPPALASAALPVAAQPASAPAPAARGRATPDDPVYLNQATMADLHRLPGVGPKRAEAILALRTKLGHFRQIEDLLKVKGIGRASLRKLRPLVRLDPPPSASTDAGT
jgi:competence protein ComEA